MYAKTLIPSLHPVPALMATTDDADILLPQLLARAAGRRSATRSLLGRRAGW